MDWLMLIKAFLVGGAMCLIAQILIDRTRLTGAYILVGYVCAGVLLSALGLYGPLVEWAGAGATVPLTGFGHTLAEGVREAVAKDGLFGALYGGIKAAAAGISAAVLFALLWSVMFRSKSK